MKFTILASALSFASAVLSAPSLGFEKRNPNGSFKLVAYGVDASATDFFYSDGLAYVGDASKWTGQVTTDVTFKFADGTIRATATKAGLTLDAETLLYIQPTANQVLPVGFSGNGHAKPTEATTDNFLFYGSILMWEGSGGKLDSSFRLKETRIGGIYQVYWDTSNTFPTGYISPVVKSKDV